MNVALPTDQAAAPSQAPTSGPDHHVHRFPKPRFLSGVGAVPALLLVVTLISSAALLLLRAPAIPQVPVTASGELGAAANRAATAYIAAADHLVQSAEQTRSAVADRKRGALLRITRANPDVDGLALIDDATRRVVTKRGDAVALPPSLPTPPDGPQVTVIDDEMVVAIPVSAERTLIGSLPARAPRLTDAPPGQRIMVTRPDGEIVAESAGRPDVPPAVVRSVAASAARGEPGFAVDDSRLVPSADPGVFAMPGKDAAPPDRVAAVGGVPVRGVAESSGLIVMVAREVPLVAGTTTTPGRTAAVAVAAGGVAAFVLLQLLLVRPTRRLRDDVNRLVADVDAGREPDSRIRRSRLWHADRIARHAALPLTMAGTRDMALSRKRRLTVGGTTLFALVAALLFAALGGAFEAVGTHQAARTDVLSERSRSTVEDTATSLEGTLTEGLAAVQASAGPRVGRTEFDWAGVVDALHTARPVFRSVYVRDAGHSIVASSGEAPHADDVPVTPLAQLNQSGPEPIVAAAAPTHDGRFTVIAEFDPRALNNVLRRADSPTEVYDSGARTVLGSDGYVSFSTVSDPALLRAGAEASVSPHAAVENVSGSDQLVAAERIGRSEATAGLGWVVLQHRDVTTARYTVDPIGRAVTVIVGLTAFAAMALLIWSYVTTIQPLRKVGDWLASTAPGSPIPAGPPPRRLDEVGALMSGLNHCVKGGERR